VAGADVAAVVAHGPLGTPHSPPASTSEHFGWLVAGRDRQEPADEGEVLDGVCSSHKPSRTHPWFHRFTPSEDKDQEGYFQDDNRRMIKILMMIGTWITQRSRLTLLSC
jgi:hypothetical protein